MTWWNITAGSDPGADSWEKRTFDTTGDTMYTRFIYSPDRVLWCSTEANMDIYNMEGDLLHSIHDDVWFYSPTFIDNYSKVIVGKFDKSVSVYNTHTAELL